ncbi:hypothetical protein ACU3L3_07275 [Priestia endophytica]
MNQRIRIIFKSGRDIEIDLLNDETFTSFWEKALKGKYFIAGDMMFNTSEVEHSTTV